MSEPFITPQDIEKFLHPGGAADTTFVLTHCLSCDKEVNRSMRWLHEQPHLCALRGGNLDDTPLHNAAIAALDAYQCALERYLRLRDPSS
jgi:hypothetical protein